MQNKKKQRPNGRSAALLTAQAQWHACPASRYHPSAYTAQLHPVPRTEHNGGTAAQAQSPDTKEGGRAKYSPALDLSRGHRKVLPEIAGEIQKGFRGRGKRPTQPTALLAATRAAQRSS